MLPMYLLFGGALLLIAGGLAIAFVLGRKRTQQLEDVARGLGLVFTKDATRDLESLKGDFELFSTGRRQRWYNLMAGDKNGTGISIFDFKYTTRSGKNSHVFRQTVVCFRAAELSLPKFTLRAEGMFHRIGSKMFGMQDIDFDTHPDFSKRFLLRGDSEARIRDAFTPEVLTFFETLDNRVCVEGNGQTLLFYRGAHLVKPGKLNGFLTEGFGVFSAFRSSMGA